MWYRFVIATAVLLHPGIVYAANCLESLGQTWRKTDLVNISAEIARPDLPDPERVSRLCVRAALFFESGRPGSALGDYDQALQLEPMNAAAHAGRVRALISLGAFQLASAELERTAPLAPDLWTFLADRCMIAFDPTRKERPADFCDKLVVSYPRTAMSYNMRGFAREKNADESGAEADYKVGLELDQNLIVTKINLANLSYRKNDPNSASSLYGGILESREASKSTKIYAAIWMNIVSARNHLAPSKAIEDSSIIESGKWPGPILSFLLGRISHDELTKIANTAPDADQGSFCEFFFYTGVEYSLKNDNDAARRSLEQAQRVCNPLFIESIDTDFELSRLNKSGG
jgi:tetratricopeptide (TPR) repeat protein